MGRYLLKRLGVTFLAALLITILLGIFVNLIPGDPVRAVLGPRGTPEMVASVREELELDEPIAVQLGSYLADVARGDLGRDLITRASVVTLIWEVLPHTVLLAIAGLAIAAALGIPLGVYSATRPNGWVDSITRTLSVALITIPPYVAALFLLLVFVVYLQLLPSIGTGDLGDPVDYVRHLILPATALALPWIGYLARLVRATLLEVLGLDYIRAARAFGLSEQLVVYKYALRNALLPTVAVLGVGLGSLLGGAVFVEIIFARAGIGSLMFDMISTRNWPVVRGCALVVALLYLLTNLLVDLSYRFLDPRVRLERAELA